MKQSAHKIYELFKKVEDSAQTRYLINIEKVGYIELSKSDIKDKLYSEYLTARLDEHSDWLKEKGVKHIDIARKMGINKEAYSMLLSGHLKSNKKVGDSLSFIDKSKEIAERLCSM